MKIDEEVAVRCVLVLTDTSFGHRRVFQSRQTPREVTTHLSESFAGSYAISAVRIKRRPVAIDGDLDAAAFQIRQAIRFIFEINPGGQSGHRKTLAIGGPAQKKKFPWGWGYFRPHTGPDNISPAH